MFIYYIERGSVWFCLVGGGVSVGVYGYIVCGGEEGRGLF